MARDLFGHKRQLVCEMDVLVLTRNFLWSDRCIETASNIVNTSISQVFAAGVLYLSLLLFEYMVSIFKE